MALIAVPGKKFNLSPTNTMTVLKKGRAMIGRRATRLFIATRETTGRGENLTREIYQIWG